MANKYWQCSGWLLKVMVSLLHSQDAPCPPTPDSTASCRNRRPRTRTPGSMLPHPLSGRGSPYLRAIGIIHGIHTSRPCVFDPGLGSALRGLAVQAMVHSQYIPDVGSMFGWKLDAIKVGSPHMILRLGIVSTIHAVSLFCLIPQKKYRRAYLQISIHKEVRNYHGMQFDSQHILKDGAEKYSEWVAIVR